LRKPARGRQVCGCDGISHRCEPPLLHYPHALTPHQAVAAALRLTFPSGGWYHASYVCVTSTQSETPCDGMHGVSRPTPPSSFAVNREYVERVEYKEFVLARWLETVNGDTTLIRWDVINDGRVVTTATDREHAESYVDHHFQNECPQHS